MPTTSTEDRTTTAEPPPDDRRRARTVAIAAAAVLVVLLAGWWWYAGQQRSLVTIGFDAVPVECSTGNVTVDDLETGFDFDPYYATVVEASADMSCDLRVHVTNDGRFTAQIREIEIPFYGPETGASIHARGMAPLGVEPLTETPGEPLLRVRDAIYAVDYPIAPGERLLLTIQLRHNPDGCTSSGATFWAGDEVLLHASALGRMGSSTTGGPTFAQRGTEDSSCDS